MQVNKRQIDKSRDGNPFDEAQSYQTVQACERADFMNIGGFSDAVFNVISACLGDKNQRFVAEVEAIEL